MEAASTVPSQRYPAADDVSTSRSTEAIVVANMTTCRTTAVSAARPISPLTSNALTTDRVIGVSSPTAPPRALTRSRRGSDAEGRGTAGEPQSRDGTPQVGQQSE